MITWNQTNNRTIIGYHDMARNRVVILKDKYPKEFEPTQTPFLLTRDTYFELTPSTFVNFIENKLKDRYFDEIMNKVSNSLIIPGLLISLAYLLKYVGVFEQIVIIETFLESPIINTFFWIAFLGVIFLWYQYYNSKGTFSKLPNAPLIPASEIEEFEHNGIAFNRYAHMNALKFVTPQLLDILDIENKTFVLNDIFNKLLQLPEIVELIKRADISDTKWSFEKEKLNRIQNNTLILYALEEALITKSNVIEPIHLFLAIIKITPILNKEVLKQDSSIFTLREISKFLIAQQNKINSYGYLNPLTPYYRTGGIAHSWIYGYTYILNQFSKEVNEDITKQSDQFGIGHEKEVELLVSVLGRPNKKHALLIGEAGVGKSSLIKGLAQRINRGDVPPILYGARIVQLDLNGLIAYSSKSKNIESVVQKSMNELAKAGNVILYIDELQELIPAKAAQSGHSFADILLPFVVEGKFAIVGTVNYSDYKKYFYTNESFRQSFSNIEIPELSAQDTMRILATKISILEKAFNIYITFPTLISCVEYAQRYVTDKLLPNSAVNLLEETCAWANSNGVKVVTSDHVAKLISMQTNIAIGEISNEESEKLISLEEKIKSRVVGQDDAVHIISESLRRARADIRDPKKPIGAFLFIGPTGVGKTYLAKTISQEYFNNEKDIVRIDMSEYMNEDSVNKLLGTNGNEANSQVTTTLIDRVKSNPYTVVLFDEIEKAHPKVLDLFLQLFDEGRLTSSNGETVNFTNTIIICTSNIASSIILESLESKMMWEETKNRVMIELKQAIRPELFNRFDNIVVFQPQTMENLTKISDMILEQLYKRLHEKNIELDWEPTIPMLIASKAYEPGLGARPIRRYIQEKVEGNIANEMIAGNIKSGDKIQIKESWIV